MINKEEIKHIAKLARLDLTEKEIDKMQKDLSEILDYFNLLKKAPKVKEKTKLEQNFDYREDKVVSSYNIKDEILAAVPDKEDDYIKVKSIL